MAGGNTFLCLKVVCQTWKKAEKEKKSPYRIHLTVQLDLARRMSHLPHSLVSRHFEEERYPAEMLRVWQNWAGKVYLPLGKPQSLLASNWWAIWMEQLAVKARGCSSFQGEQIVSSWMQVRTASLSAENCRLAWIARGWKGDGCFSYVFFPLGWVVSIQSSKRCAPRMRKEISHWNVLAHERKNSGSFQRMAKVQNLLTEAYSCGWLLQHTPPAGGVAT